MADQTFPFVVRVNGNIRFVQPQPFKEGAQATIEGAMPNGQFVHVREHNRPLHIDRFDLNDEQLDLIRNKHKRDS